MAGYVDILSSSEMFSDIPQFVTSMCLSINDIIMRDQCLLQTDGDNPLDEEEADEQVPLSFHNLTLFVLFRLN